MSQKGEKGGSRMDGILSTMCIGMALFFLVYGISIIQEK